MEQLERIARMEQALNDSVQALAALERALEGYQQVQDGLHELIEYYQSPLWLKDYDDDNEGRIPGDTSRGVLSQDGVWDMLTDQNRLLAWMRDICRAEEP